MSSNKNKLSSFTKNYEGLSHYSSQKQAQSHNDRQKDVFPEGHETLKEKRKFDITRNIAYKNHILLSERSQKSMQEQLIQGAIASLNNHFGLNISLESDQKNT